MSFFRATPHFPHERSLVVPVAAGTSAEQGRQRLVVAAVFGRMLMHHRVSSPRGVEAESVRWTGGDVR